MTLFGVARLDFVLATELPASALVATLEPLGFKEPAIRATLRRNVERGLLSTVRDGREVSYRLSPTGLSLVSQGRARVNDPAALEHVTAEWTLLTFPEGPALRNERYQLNLRLAWAGFGRLMPGVWLTPGQSDVFALLTEAFDGDIPGDAVGFTSVPLREQDIPGMISRAWDLDAIRAHHELFNRTWKGRIHALSHPLADLVHLLNDWSTLLLADPGLPASGVPHDWPAQSSMATMRTNKESLWEPARAQLESLLNK
jgi:phenylacetic acid degradation operon negative regulatory protein